MIYSLKIAWRNIVGRPIQTLVTALVVALAIALFVTVALLSDALQRGIVRASDPFGVLVVGAKGSAQQLVLSTLLLQGNPVGNIPHEIYAALAADPRVALAVPLAMGDNVGGARIIGTNANFFLLRPSELEPPAFQLAAGALFNEDFQAVLGSTAAVGLGLGIGDQFVPAHGVSPGLAEDVHEARHTVVGILRPSHTSFDNAVFTTLESVLHVHAEEMRGAATEATDAAADDHADDSVDDHADEQADEDHGQVTAILIKPVGFVEQNQIWQEFYTGTAAQAAFPGRELGGLFDLLRQAQELLRVVGYLAAGMAALTLFLAVYSAASARERLLAIMRGLGASRATVFQVVMLEALLAALMGALIGRLLGYGVAALIAGSLAQQSAIPITIRYLPALEPLLWLLPLLLGLVAGLIPAWQAYRVNVIEKLFPA
jgi:putative ABC transport system permease protein